MSKEIENKVCAECESTYRIVYNLEDTSGFTKFCPFCGCENTEPEKYEEDDE